ncbi:hypothetical protein [Streptomyces sp. IMTB 2501]|uniref:hypothetical protein n=1 Tax=Streptomyces sp. IMTB 2501 TaxID=1776340 RepID=UPI00211605E5|nr:hypothetical protein [Streptomyces sp. IMTB 2501]
MYVSAVLIVSVAEQLPDNGRDGGHLVILRGYEDGPDPTTHFRDPSAWGQTHDRVPRSRLSPFRTGRASTFRPLIPSGES